MRNLTARLLVLVVAATAVLLVLPEVLVRPTSPDTLPSEVESKLAPAGASADSTRAPISASQEVSVLILGPNAEPVPGTAVQVISLETGEEVALLQTDPDGLVAIPAETGDRVLLVCNRVFTNSRMSGHGIVVSNPKMPILQEIRLSEEQTAVVGLALRDGVPMVGLTVPGFTVPDATVDSDGLFSLGNYPAGSVLIRIGDRQNVHYSTRMQLASGETKYLQVSLSGSGIQVNLIQQDADSSSAEGVLVVVEEYPLSSSRIRRHARTDRAGKVMFDGVPPGEYLVSVGHYLSPTRDVDWQSPWAPAFRRIQVQTGTSVVDIPLVVPCELRYRVMDPGHNWQVPAHVFLRLPGIGIVQDWRRPILPAARGYSTLRLPPGELDVIAANTNGWGELHLNLFPGEVYEGDIVLSGSLPGLSLRVFGDYAERVDRIEIHDSQGGLAWHWERRVIATTDWVQDEGNPPSANSSQPQQSEPGLTFEITSMPVGYYTVTCFAGGVIVGRNSVGLTGDTVLDIHTQ